MINQFYSEVIEYIYFRKTIVAPFYDASIGLSKYDSIIFHQTFDIIVL